MDDPRQDFERPRRRRTRRRIAGIGMALALVAALAGAAQANHSYGPMPGSGYTFDSNWQCGWIYSGANCYQPGGVCLTFSCGHNHSFGWASVDEDHAAVVDVQVRAEYVSGGGYGDWGIDGHDLVRTCYAWASGCNDPPDSYMYKLRVKHWNDGSYYVIKGHGKA